MQISRHGRTTAVFVLTWDDVEKISEKLIASLPMLTISAETSDGLKRVFDDVAELKNFRNAKKSEIVELDFTSRDVPFGQRCTISFTVRPHGNISFSIDASEEIALRLNEFYEDLLDSIRPWYSFVARANWESIMMRTMLLVFFFSLTAMFISGKLDSVKIGDFSGLVVSEALIFAVIPWVFIGMMNFVKVRFFPMGAFSIGDGVKRYQNLETLRTVVVFGFFISIATSTVMLIF